MTSSVRYLYVFAAALALALATQAAAFASPLVQGMQSDNLVRSPDPVTRDYAFRNMRDLGARVVRVGMSWRSVAEGCAHVTDAARADNTTPCYDWSIYDSVVQRARDNGLQVLLSVSESPTWISHNANGYEVGTTNAAYENTVNEFATFLHAAATRYAAGSSIGFVPYWTIWNEPNSRTFWLPFNADSPRRYAEMVAKGAKAIRHASPRAQVAAGPTGPKSTGMKPLPYIAAVQPWLLRYGARPFLTAWAHNPYPAPNRSPRTRVYVAPSVGMGNFDDLVSALDASPATRGKPIWATEFSYQTNPPDRTGVSALSQATFLAESYDILAATGRVTIAIWYVLRDPVGEPDWQSGLLTANGRRKAAYAMYQRPISRSALVVNRGSTARIWGRSNVSPKTATLVWSTNGRTWRRIPGVHRGASGFVAVPKFTASMLVAVQDARGRGPVRKVAVR